MKTGTPWRLKFSASVCRRHGLAGAGGAGDETVPVRHPGQEKALDVAVPGQQDRFGHGVVREAEGMSV